jgi:hypothetical protein
MSGRSCSAACAVFFECQAAAVEECPQRRASRTNTTLRSQLVQHLADGDFRLRLDLPENVVAMPIKLGTARLTLPARPAIARLACLPHPADRRRQPDPEPRCRLTRGQPLCSHMKD